MTLLRYGLGMLHNCVRWSSVEAEHLVDALAAPLAERLTGPGVALRTHFQEERHMAKVEHGQIIESATEARAGETGGHMRWVLFASTFLVAAIFAGLIAYYFGA